MTKAQMQFIRSLQSRKTRDELGLFVAEGPKVVAELLAADAVQVQDVFATAGWARQNAAWIRQAGGNVIEIDDATLARISSLAGPNQVVAVFTKPHLEEEEAVNWFEQFSLALDGIQDPGNLGTILRCADWFGVQHVICNPACANPFNAKVVQATMGSIARVRVHQCADLAEFLEENAAGAPIYAATFDGASLYDEPAAPAGFLIIGNESRGISAEVLAHATRPVTIPRIGAAESLNAAVATGIVLSHLRGRQSFY